MYVMHPCTYEPTWLLFLHASQSSLLTLFCQSRSPADGNIFFQLVSGFSFACLNLIPSLKPLLLWGFKRRYGQFRKTLSKYPSNDTESKVLRHTSFFDFWLTFYGQDPLYGRLLLKVFVSQTAGTPAGTPWYSSYSSYPILNDFFQQ